MLSTSSETSTDSRIESPIVEGATVRQGQPLFYLPDPNLMQVKAKVNESKVALIQSGQPARVVIDAFPDRPLRGTVTEITPIPAPASSASSDVRVYFAAGKDALRAVMDAQQSRNDHAIGLAKIGARGRTVQRRTTKDDREVGRAGRNL